MDGGSASEPRTDPRGGRSALALGWLALASLMLALALSGRGPGLYYDEAWFAQQARAFVGPARAGGMPPGVSSVVLAGRPFPTFVAPYLGALKSQLAIPALALFGARLETVRLATLLATRRLFGLPTALLAGALVAFDPTIFFHAQWEWGPFTAGFLCRALGAWLLLRSAQDGGLASACLGGLALGASVYNRADSVVVIGAVVLGVALVHPGRLAGWVRVRRGELASALAGFVLGALPMLLTVPRVLASLRAVRERGDLGERWRTLLATLDGSYVHRLMEQGGRFELLHEAPAPVALLGVAFAVAGVGCAASAWRGGRRGSGARADGLAALGVACVLLTAAMLALRGATRAHHMLNLAPLVHVFVAASLVALARLGQRARLLAAGLALAILASDALSIAETRALVARSGGRGWWSDALLELARELEAAPGAVAVSLDWGFHLPLLFVTETPALLEPIWTIAQQARRTGTWSHLGTARHRYLVHDARWDRFGFGPSFLAAARALGKRAEIRAWRDREGGVAFYVVRFGAPHRVSFRPGRGFAIDLAHTRAGGERSSPGTFVTAAGGSGSKRPLETGPRSGSKNRVMSPPRAPVSSGRNSDAISAAGARR